VVNNCPAAQAQYLRDYKDVSLWAGVAHAGSNKYNQGQGSTNGAINHAWGHYQQVGKAQGRTWHTEFCNADGSNKGMSGTCFSKHTTKLYHYDMLKAPCNEAGCNVVFAVAAGNDAHIGFFNSRTTKGSAYEIVLGGWGNHKSVIRKGKQGKNHGGCGHGAADAGGCNAAQGNAGVKCTNKGGNINCGWLSRGSARQFWAAQVKGLVQLGAGDKVGVNVITEWQDPTYSSAHWADNARFVGVATGWGSSGDWHVCLGQIGGVSTHPAGVAHITVDNGYKLLIGGTIPGTIDQNAGGASGKYSVQTIGSVVPCNKAGQQQVGNMNPGAGGGVNCAGPNKGGAAWAYTHVHTFQMSCAAPTVYGIDAIDR